ncbi:MAG: hypothetical protein EHM58_03550 [Ignavibacteriae bacterium]|nr:MAG: hypothetical protein EHM58_03550 [Ignavibacteriota bacterium]
MGTLFSILKKALSFFLLLLIIYPALSQNDDNKKQYIENFELHLEHKIYLPGDAVKIQLLFDRTPLNPDIKIKIYRITDIEKFYTSQQDIEHWSIFNKDSIKLSQYLIEIADIDKMSNRLGNYSGYKTVYEAYTDYVPNEKGAYFVRAYCNKQCANTGFWVSEMSLLTKCNTGFANCFVINNKTGDIIDSVNLFLFVNKNKIGQFECLTGIWNYFYTNEDKKLFRNEFLNKPILIAQKGNDFIVSSPSEYFYSKADKFCNAYITTSQPVYKPNNLLEFKGTVRNIIDNGYSNFPDREVFVEIKDSKNTSVYQKILKTNSNGSFAGEYFIESEAPLGNYTIEATIDGAKNAGEQVNKGITFESQFEVKVFKNPEYYVNVTTDKEQYFNGDKIKGKISAKYYFGSPVQDAEVKYYIFKEAIYKPWWYYSRYRWFYEDFYSSIVNSNNYNTTKILSKKGKLDKEGNFEFSHNIKEDFKYKNNSWYSSAKEADYKYIIKCIITDKSRREIEGDKSVSVTRAGFEITSSCDKYYYKAYDIVSLEITAMDFSEKPVKSPFQVTVTRYEQQKEYRDLEYFVTTLSGYTDPVTGKGSVFFTPKEDGKYRFDVIAYDNNNKHITNSVSTYVLSKSYWCISNESSAIEVYPDKLTYNTGDTCRLLIISFVPDVTLLISAYNDNFINNKAVKINGNSEYVNIPVNEALSPNFSVNAAYINDNNLHDKNIQLIAIPEKKILDVQVTSDKPVYKPKEEGLIKVKVTDYYGNPVSNAEVCIGMIDESIYAIAPENNKEIKKNFYKAGKNEIKPRYFGRSISYISSFSDFIFLNELYDKKAYNETEMGVIKGNVTDEDGKGMRGICIAVNNMYVAGITNYDGYYEFRIPDGDYNLNLFKTQNIISGSIKIMSLKGITSRYDIITDGKYIINSEEARIKAQQKRIEDSLKVLQNIKNGNFTGSINGFVFDDKDKTPLAGAIVKLEGIQKGAETDDNGEFTILNVDAGTYNVVASYVGYSSVKILAVKVSPGKISSVDFELPQAGYTLDTVMISIVGKRRSIELEVLTGDFGAEYGNALSGIINVTKKEQYVEPELRTDFRDAMYWNPAVYTNENGIAEVKVKFPDNLSTWRVTARVITNDTKVGQITNSVISRKDLIIRMETPMFFQKDDEVTVSTIVHNYLEENKNTKVSLNLENLKLSGNTNSEKEILLEKNSEQRIDWKVKVTDAAGLATLTAKALTNEESDAVQYSIPLQPRGIKISDCKTVTINKENNNESIEFELSEDIDRSTAGLKVDISPSVISSLKEALPGLIDYPYGCMEQTLSRFVPAVLVANIYKNSGASFDEYLNKKIEKVVNVGFSKTYSLQHDDGGWGWWSNDKSSYFMTAYALYCLSLAGSSGYEVDSVKYKAGVKYLKRKLQEKEFEPEVRAFSLYALSFSLKNDYKFFEEQADILSRTRLSSFSLALLALTSAQYGDKEKQSQFIEALVKNVKHDEHGYYWNGEKPYKWTGDAIQITSFGLKALISDSVSFEENRELAGNVVQWLMKNNRGNSWGSTQQTAFAVYALSDYAAVNKEIRPQYTINIYLNNVQMAERVVNTGNIFAELESINIPGTVIKKGQNILKAVKTGNGNAYLNASLNYYSNEEHLQSGNNGFKVTKEYFKLEEYQKEKDKSFVYRKIPFTGEVTSGDVIFVKIKVKSKSDDLNYFMLEDPLPAGCVNIEEEWMYNIDGEKQGRKYDFDYWYDDDWVWWYSQKEVRANKICFFSTDIDRDEFEFTYLLRAQIPGVYNVTPTIGSLMYYPEVNGTGKEIKIEIKDK